VCYLDKKNPYNKMFYNIMTKYIISKCFGMFVRQLWLAKDCKYKFTGYDNFGRPFMTFSDFYRIYNMLLTVEYTLN